MREARQEKRKLKDLNLVDNFLFNKMISHEVYGERFARILLETIFQRSFGELTLIGQKPYYGGDTDHKSIILDVYIEEQIITDQIDQTDRKPEQDTAKDPAKDLAQMSADSA